MNRTFDPAAVREAASRWMARRDAGMSPAEEVELENWRNAHPAHAEALARYERLWDRIEGPPVPGAGAEVTREVARLEGRGHRIRRGVAALCLLAGLGVGVAGWSLRRSPEAAGDSNSMVVIAPQQRVLPDGSVVEFPAGAVFAVDFSSPAVRRVMLDRGEAHFVVAKNPTRPFVVRAGGVDVQAVGTAFAVQLASSAVDVIVTEGRVAVDRAAETLPAPMPAAPSLTAAYVGAGEKLSVAKLLVGGGAAQVEPISAAELAQRLAWRNLRMEFSNTLLPEVLAAINHHGGARFKLADASLQRVRVSGIFRVDDPRSFVGILETGFGIQSELVESNTYELRGAR